MMLQCCTTGKNGTLPYHKLYLDFDLLAMVVPVFMSRVVWNSYTDNCSIYEDNCGIYTDNCGIYG